MTHSSCPPLPMAFCSFRFESSIAGLTFGLVVSTSLAAQYNSENTASWNDFCCTASMACLKVPLKNWASIYSNFKTKTKPLLPNFGCQVSLSTLTLSVSTIFSAGKESLAHTLLTLTNCHCFADCWFSDLKVDINLSICNLKYFVCVTELLKHLGRV